MACRVDLNVLIRDGYDCWTGLAICYMDNPPALGISFGDSNLLIVNQIRYLGVTPGSDKDHYSVKFDKVVGHRVIERISTSTPWLSWDFAKME